MKPLITFSLCLLWATQLSAQSLLSSPNGQLQVEIGTKWPLQIRILKGNAALATAQADLITTIGSQKTGSALKAGKVRQVRHTYTDTLARIPKVQDYYNEIELGNGSLVVRVRAYDNGIAYRFELPAYDTIVGIKSESFTLAADTASRLTAAYRPLKPGPLNKYYSSFENTYDTLRLSQLDTAKRLLTPALLTLKNGTHLLITDASVHAYPGMYLKGKAGALNSEFSPQVKGWRGDTDNPKEKYALTTPTGFEDVLAKRAPSKLPWRVIGFCQNDNELLTWQLTRQLADSAKGDFSWVKPGKVAWDWWNEWNLRGVDFKAGMNTQTFKAYIDFASRHRLPYIILDEGWATSLATMMDVKPEVDLPALVAYGKEKGVSLILWASAYALNDRMEEAMTKYSRMGIKGFKVDFLDSDDARMNAFMEKAVRRAADYKLMIDWHGCSKPVGLERQYPNEINREGVYGNEQYKWSDKANPRQHLLLQTVRQAAGSMDYTPGAVRTANEREFKPIFRRPMAKGTRCHQMAMYVCQHAPLMMLCDSPTDYKREPDMMAFLEQVPTVWDEARVISSELGKHMAWAKRRGKQWFIGAMAAGPERPITLDLSFLPAGTKLDAYQDGINCYRDATDYKRSEITLPKDGRVTINLAEGGGFVGVVK